jgi:hypothetical protein|tara:strand:+ start:1008 stop:1625 length:618 start_codon:yes stop_codon:yes gene_type:complete
MSQRNFKYLHDNRIIYGRTPITDVPTESTDIYDYYENGTYECYALFRSKAKITTYKSLKWHFLVIQHLNGDLNMKELKRVFEYIANVKNNFVTFTMSRGAFDKLVNEVFITDAERPPKNRIRKVIFKPNKILTLSEKLSIVGQLIGRSKKIVEEDIYQCMLDLNDNKQKITISKLAKLLECSTRTIYRNMGNQLKLEKELLNKEL